MTELLTVAVDVKLVQDNLPQLLETRAWPKFIVAGAQVMAPRFCRDDCDGEHFCHLRRDQFWMCFCGENGETRSIYRYVGRDQAADTSLWELSELRDG